MMNMQMLHPWHGPEPGKEAPGRVNALIEISKGSRCKYEIDKESGLLRLDRVIHSSFHYPVNYGFIPRSLGEDGDALDILVICSEEIKPLCLVEANVIGNMQMTDNGMKDDKIIAVASNDPEVNHISSVAELPPHFLHMLRNYFEQYKVLEKKQVVIDEFQEKKAAMEIILRSLELYRSRFNTL